MSSKKKKLLQTILTANAGCGNCGRPKLSDVYDPTPIMPKPKTSISQKYQTPNFSSSSSCGRSSSAVGFSLMDKEEDCMTNSTTITFNKNSNTSTTTTAQNSESETDPNLKPSKIRDDSIAVVKDSNNPFQDFRRSMLQMILEKNIYSKDDLEELLNCFLELNSPSLHNVIVQAFSELWNSDEINKKKRSCVRCVSHDDHDRS